jgi:4-amino-4-deoxy-L-arabinose transferase-like glycosyltransferase
MIRTLFDFVHRTCLADDKKRLRALLIVAFAIRFLSILPYGNGIAVPLRDQNTYYGLGRCIVEEGFLGVPSEAKGPYIEFREKHPRTKGFYPTFHDSMAAAWDEEGYLYGVVPWGKPNSFFEPFYPLLAAGMYLLFGDNFFFWRMVHVILGTLLVYFIYDIGKHAFKDWRVATLAAFWVAIYPHALFYTWVLMSEPLLLVLLAASFWAYFRLLDDPSLRWAILMGVLFAAFVLTRSFLLAFFPVMLVFVVIFIKSPKRWLFAGSALLAFVLTMSPWIIRNYNLQGRFVLLSTRGGYNLWMRNNPYFIEDELKAMGVEFPPEKLDNLKYREYILGYPEFTPDQGELERNAVLTREGIKFIRANPGFFLQLCWNRFKWTIGWRSIGLKGPLLNGISLLFYGPVLLGFIISLFIGWKRLEVTLPLWSVVGYFILFYSLTHAGLRYRLPVDPLMMLLAAFAAVFIYSKWKKTPFLIT